MINEIVTRIKALNKPAIIAIDGRCGSGKTTLASTLEKELSCNVVHMDDFFLRPEQRNEKRLEEPGGNIDYERFLKEILYPLNQGTTCYYRPYLCHSQSFGNPIILTHNDITIVEGSYSCHPALYDFYDLHIFLDIDSKEQLKRIIKRNGEDNAKLFKERWIPLEEMYFNAFQIRENCEVVYKTADTTN